MAKKKTEQNGGAPEQPVNPPVPEEPKAAESAAADTGTDEEEEDLPAVAAHSSGANELLCRMMKDQLICAYMMSEHFYSFFRKRDILLSWL